MGSTGLTIALLEWKTVQSITVIEMQMLHVKQIESVNIYSIAKQGSK